MDGFLHLCGDSISRSRGERLPCKGSLSPGDLCGRGISAPEKTSLTALGLCKNACCSTQGTGSLLLVLKTL